MANDNTAMVPADSAEVAVAKLTTEQMDVVRETICAGYSNTEMMLYLHQCEAMALDPLARETYTFKAGNGIVIGVGIDGFRKRANDTGCYMPGRPTEYEMDDKGKLVMARVYVKKLVGGEWHEFSEDAYMEEFKGKGQWNVMPRVMLSKCAEARVLRRAFPRELGGLYEPAERAAIERGNRPVKQDPFAPPPVEVEAEVVTPETTPYDDLVTICKREGHTKEDVIAAMKETGHSGDVNDFTAADCDEILTAIERAKGA
jgi:phage recombination protein Bet